MNHPKQPHYYKYLILLYFRLYLTLVHASYAKSNLVTIPIIFQIKFILIRLLIGFVKYDTDIMYILPDSVREGYDRNKLAIKKRLVEFSAIPKEEYFYELCFCICTPQSKAANAWQVQKKLAERNFYEKPFDPVDILNDKSHYIRFHNQKAQRLLEVREQWPEIKAVLESDMTNIEKRFWLFDNVKGMGLKESAHYLRNIGYRNLGILDRHILKHLVSCQVYSEIPNISGKKRYLEVEAKFQEFAEFIGIPIDELDLLFWSYEAGEILK